MSTIYWITRLDAINSISITFLVFSIVTSIIFFMLFIINYCSLQQECHSDRYYEEAKKFKKVGIKGLKISVPIFVISILSLIFVPTTRQAFLIYGVGGAIDYLKENPTAKQLPDKCIKALDRWVDSIETEEKKDSIN